MNLYKKRLKLFKDRYHRSCLFNRENSFIDDLRISFLDNGDLQGVFYCHQSYQGYDGMMHGGITSALIDSAMTQCLFGHGIAAYTVRLNLKYVRAVQINREIIIHVSLNDQENDHFLSLSAVIIQDEVKRVTAQAKFWMINDPEQDQKNISK